MQVYSSYIIGYDIWSTPLYLELDECIGSIWVNGSLINAASDHNEGPYEFLSFLTSSEISQNGHFRI